MSAEREAYLRGAPSRGGRGTGIGDALLEAIRAQAVAAGLLSGWVELTVVLLTLGSRGRDDRLV